MTTGPTMRRGVPEGLLSAVLAALLVVIVLIEIEVTSRPARGTITGTTLDETGIGYGITGLVIGIAGLVVLRGGRRSGAGGGFGWVLVAVGLFWALDGLSQSYVRLAVATPDPIPGAGFATWFLFRFTAFLPLSIVALPLLFPAGRFVAGRVGHLGRLTLVLLALAALFVILSPFAEDPADTPVPPGVDPDPTTIEALEPLRGALGGLFVLALLLGVAVPILTVVARYRRSSGLERDQERWLLWGVLIAALAIVGSILLDADVVVQASLFIAVTVTPVSMAVAVVNPRLVAIDDLLVRTAVFGGLLLALVAADLAVLAVLTTVLDDALDQRQVVVVVLMVSLLLYGPLRNRLWNAVRRLAFGERDNRYDVVAGLASTLESTDDGATQLGALTRAVSSAFGVAFVQVEVERSGGERLVATHGRRPDAVRELPIAYREERIGRLVLPARGIRSRLSRRDERLLADLVRQTATAIRTGQLSEELQRSRERLVVAREEERRRIRRDLHDGLGPALSGTVFQLEAARLDVARDPEAAATSIARTSAQVQEIVADVRRLVHDLRPPALDDRGLVGAIRQQADALTSGGLEITVAAGDLGALPAAVEVAAFRIVSEALTNVVRHAGADHAVVCLRVPEETPDRLEVEIRDDGAGIPVDVQAGVGLLSLRERADELGGRVEIRCPQEGGTTVLAHLPLRRST